MNQTFLLLNRCLTKSYPKDLPNLSVVLIYLNEALSIIKRALRSIISRTPKHLLKEIIMVDDNSSNGGFVCHKGSRSASPWAIQKRLTLQTTQFNGRQERCCCSCSHLKISVHTWNSDPNTPCSGISVMIAAVIILHFLLMVHETVMGFWCMNRVCSSPQFWHRTGLRHDYFFLKT